MLTPALGCLGAALSMSLPWPQVWRSCGQGRTTGLSATASFLGVAMPIGWITYGLLIGDRLQVVTNTVTGGAGVAVLVALLLARTELRRGRSLLASAAAAAGVVFAALAGLVTAAFPQVSGAHVAPMLGVVLAVAATLSAVPQPWALLRDRTQDLSGLSPLRWRLALAACSCWTLYGLGTGQAAVWSSALVGLIGAAVVCAVVAARTASSAAGVVPTAADIAATSWRESDVAALRLRESEVSALHWRESVNTRSLAMVGA
jgi:uncharacterized protein with PQ loop repeat